MPRRRTELVIVAPFPPPMGGAAYISDAVYRAARAGKTPTRRFDTSARTLGHQRSATYHLRRIANTAYTAAALAALVGRRTTLYLVPDAGLGVWYTCLFTLASARSQRVFIHHHSCRYIEHDSRAMRIIAKVTRKRGTHVFLTSQMAESFARVYGQVETRVVGNAAYTNPGAPPASAVYGPLRIGHLSNLCSAKGFYQVCEAVELLRESGIDFHVHFAGPILEEGVAKRLARLSDGGHSDVTYHGPVYGADKSRFYASLDLFLFPTNFDQEAAPNVVYEAAAQGVPVLSVNRGCIPEILESLEGVAFDKSADFPTLTLDWIELNRNRVRSSREYRKERFVTLHHEARHQFADLIEDLTVAVSDRRSTL